MSLRAVVVVCGLSVACVAVGQTRTYEVEIDITWSTTTHPGAFPNAAHFSWFGGAAHSDAVSFWEVGEVASPGMKRMAETGATDVLVDVEVQASLDMGTSLAAIDQRHWFCPAETVHGSCGPTTFMIEVTPDYPLVTMVSMLGPSPDWFVGVSGQTLRDGDGWSQELVIDLHPYDGGTRSNNNTFNLFGPLNDPPAPISVITEKSGQIITPASLGSMTFRFVIPPCAADLDGDGVVDAFDLADVLAAWGQPGATDFDGDGVTGSADLAVVLAGWGVCE